MGKEQINEVFADRSDIAEESSLRAQDVAQDVSHASRSNEHSIESRLATWHSSNGSRRGGSVGSLGFASHGSQGLETMHRAPQNEDSWIDAWIKQCDFGVAPQVLESPLDTYEDRIFCHETDAPYAAESRSSGHDQANLDESFNDELVPLNSLNGTSNIMERLTKRASLPPRPNLQSARGSNYSPFNGTSDIMEQRAKRASLPPRPNFQSARGSNHSSSAASATYANEAHLSASSGYVSAADSGHYSSAASVADSWASSAGSHVSSANSHPSLASAQSKRKGKRKAPDSEWHSSTAPEGKPYQCTWCFRAFRRPQEWNRHERSVHFEMKKFVCMPDGPAIRIVRPDHCVINCVFCGYIDPSPEHLNIQHGTAACLTKNIHERTFPRKDGLVQHIKRSHADGLWADPNELADCWTRAGDVDEDYPCWECGFCGKDNMSWSERYKHVRDHFKVHADMRTWAGRDPKDGKYYCHTDWEPERKDLPCQRTSNKRNEQYPDRMELLQHLSKHHSYLIRLQYPDEDNNSGEQPPPFLYYPCIKNH